MSGETVPYVQPYFQILTVFWRLEMKPEPPRGRGQEISMCQLDVKGKVSFCSPAPQSPFPSHASFLCASGGLMGVTCVAVSAGFENSRFEGQQFSAPVKVNFLSIRVYQWCRLS